MGHLVDLRPERALSSLAHPMGRLTAKLTSPQSKHIRFTLAQDKRIEDACTHLGCSMQSFIQEATLDRLAKIEAEMRADKDYRTSKKTSMRHREVRGLGLRTERPEAPTVADPPPTPQVIVNVPATASSTTSDVSMLAAFVAKGSVLGREMRIDRAREVLSASLDGASLDAAKKALDDAVAAQASKDIESRMSKTGVLDWFKR